MNGNNKQKIFSKNNIMKFEKYMDIIGLNKKQKNFLIIFNKSNQAQF